MKAKQFCEICKGFGEVGFTDIGLICEGCYNIETAKNSFNQGVEKAAKHLEKILQESNSVDIVNEILKLKVVVHNKIEDKS